MWTTSSVSLAFRAACVQLRIVRPHVCSNSYGVPDVPPIWLVNVTDEAMTDILYTKEMQKIFGVANFWRDPNYSNYLKHNEYLPLLNNELSDNITAAFRDNFLRVGHVSLYGSPQDMFITPWYSSMFEFYDEKENRNNMTNQPYYVSDSFGLKTLDERGGLTRVEVPHVHHAEWLHTESLFTEYMLPLLT
eukprot:TRINITY_DN2749_c0_g1_i2.p2 TRINITY_DN2749_c0_g1~~TRINITY_DN2749_c0_g1_i2.p2  ORF type:complete len:190 (+),score=57.55 TRINITY_DN2749_c0_g1_i2:381-950(+)